LTKEQVIELYPVADPSSAESLSLWGNTYFEVILISVIVFIIVSYFGRSVKNHPKISTGLSVLALISVGTLVAGIYMFMITLNDTVDEKKVLLFEQQKDWRENIYKPYVEQVDQVKVKIFQSRWNPSGNLDLILETAMNGRKTFSDIQEFSFYDATDPDDKGYVILKDFGEEIDIPYDKNTLDLKLFFSTQYQVKEVFLPRQFIESSKN